MPLQADGSPSAARRVALLGLLCALAVSLSALEGLLPALPVPGARPGLANLVTMYALSAVSFPCAVCVNAVRALVALLTRGVSAALLSAVGGALSLAVTAAALRLRPHVSYIGVGMLGAAAHNVGQWLAALLLLDTVLVYYLPYLLLTALVSGACTGLTLNIVYPYLQKGVL